MVEKNMYNLENMFRRQKKTLIFLIFIFAIFAIVTPFKLEFRGLFLGTIASFFNLWIMVKKTVGFQKMVVEGGQKVHSIGFVERLISTALVAGVAVVFPDYLSVYFVLMGLVAMYVVIIIDFAIFLFKRKQ